MIRFSDLPPPLRLYVSAMVFAATFVVAVTPLPDWRDQQQLLIGLIILAGLSGIARVRLVLPHQWISLGTVVICLALLRVDLPASMLCGAVHALVGTYFFRSRKSPTQPLAPVPLHRTAFNVAACVLTAWIAGTGYTLSLKLRPYLGPETVILALGVWATLYFIANTASVTEAIAIGERKQFLPLWREHSLWTAPGYVAAASLAGCIDRLGLWAVLPLPAVYAVFEYYREHAARIRMQEAHIQELNQLTEEVMGTLAMAIEAKDRYTREHIHRVQRYAVALAEAAGVEKSELEAVRLGALVHDVGKIAVPERILSKPGKLTLEEFARIKTHVTVGAMLLEPVRFPYPVVPAVRSHHERWDGLGYPDGLKGEAIPVGGRIIAIADMFDALTSDRPYRRAMDLDQALAMVVNGAGSQFDPRLVEVFQRIFPRIIEEFAAARDSADAERMKLPESVLAQIAAVATEDLAAAFELSQSLLGNPDDELLQRALEKIVTLLPAVSAVIYEIDPIGEELIATTVTGEYADLLQGMVIRVGEGISGRAARDQRSYANASALIDVGRVFDPREHMELSGALCVPVVVRDETVAVIALYHTSYEIYTQQHVRVLATIAEHLATAIDFRRQSLHDRALAMSDPATGLYNSRYLMQYLARTLPEAQSEERPIVLLLLDLNRFRDVNERLGHLMGDEAIREVAARLRNCARADDVVCRYAGDEFVLVLNGASPEATDRMCERVRTAIASIDRWPGIQLTCTIGTATFPEDGTSLKALVATADLRLHHEKARHRSEVVSADLLGLDLPESWRRSRLE